MRAHSRAVATWATWASLALVSCKREAPRENTVPSVGAKKTSTKDGTKPDLDFDDPEQCAPCHTEVVDEWKTSMHARAHHESDPIYAAMRSLRMKKEGPQLAEKCANCHGPRSPKDPDTKIAKTGVNCATCHMLENVDRGGGKTSGAAALTFAEGVLRGPRDPVNPAAAPHGRGPAAPWLTDGESICLVCHDAMKNAEGVATCTTGTEYAGSSKQKPCVSCHMPEVASPNGPVATTSKHRSHAFLGPHQLYDGPGSSDFMASAIEFEGSIAPGSLRLTLRNRSGHSVPSGFPGRMILLQVKGFGLDDRELFSNFRDDPMSEDPQAVLNKIYVDAEGKPTLPPYAKEMKRDSRLRPDEERTLVWKLSRGVNRVEVEVFYRLLPPPAGMALGLAGAPLAAARSIRKLRYSLSD